MGDAADDLKPGDLAIVRHWHSRHIVTVLRVTATQVLAHHGDPDSPSRFRRRDGRRVGDSGWDVAHIGPATPEELAEIERDDLAAWLTRVPKADWCGLGVDRLRELKAALRKPPAQSAGNGEG